jgi:thiamine pyrophosphate-dependent acetolactate synthase large subunit-like protein
MTAITCGEATIRLLEKYGVTTVFGIPGVHTLDFCRGLGGAVRHVQARNEQGAGFMAEGWARATGQPGVALVISGPGVTNASTALGQAWADSLPLLLLSAEAASYTIGKGWGVLHEITEQKKVTEPLTALSATAHRAQDVPGLIARAFTIFSSERPRPVHISIPIDVQAETVDEEWLPVRLPGLPRPGDEQIDAAARLLRNAESPLIMVGGGATRAASELTAVAETLGAIVVASTAAKGIVPDDHPLSLSASTVRPEVLRLLSEADAILAVGTELSETDSFVERMDLRGRLVRIDIDPAKINDFYPAEIGIVADAATALSGLASALDGHVPAGRAAAQARVEQLRAEIAANLSASEKQHAAVWRALAEVAPQDLVWSGDACQLVYSGAFLMSMRAPRRWFYPAGYCALGNALPNAIGAKLARPDTPVAVVAGDGGYMFTMPELMTAAELGLPLPIVIWENGGLKQIQDDMDGREIPRVGVEGINPDFVMLARACHCHGVDASSLEELQSAFRDALAADRPSVIVYHEHRNQ